MNLYDILCLRILASGAIGGLVHIICIGIDTMILSELTVWAVCIYRVAILLEWLMYLLIYDPLTAVDSRSKPKLVVR